LKNQKKRYRHSVSFFLATTWASRQLLNHQEECRILRAVFDFQFCFSTELPNTCNRGFGSETAATNQASSEQFQETTLFIRILRTA
jgi:hypothetical protein